VSTLVRVAARTVVCVLDGCCALGAAITGTPCEGRLCPGLRERIETERAIAEFRRELRLI
jgi:hypothetical protein